MGVEGECRDGEGGPAGTEGHIHPSSPAPGLVGATQFLAVHAVPSAPSAEKEALRRNVRCFLISILPCHSSPAPAAERGPPVSTTAHEVGILPQRFVPGPGGAGKVPC